MKAILILFIVLISGCSDYAKVNFGNNVDLVQDAELQLKSAIEDIAIISKFEWEKDLKNSTKSNKYVNIRVNAKKGAENYSIDTVMKRLQNTFAYEEPDKPDEPEITLSVEVTDTDQSSLELFDVQTGDIISAKVMWESANAGIYYTRGRTYSTGSSTSEYFCAIQASLESGIPAFIYKQEFTANTTDSYALALAEIMSLRRLKHNHSLQGLPIDPDLYQLQLQPGHHTEDYRYVLMVFEHLGEKKVYNNMHAFTSPPDGHSNSSCQELIRERVGLDLFKSADKVATVAAEKNIVSVIKI